MAGRTTEQYPSRKLKHLVLFLAALLCVSPAVPTKPRQHTSDECMASVIFYEARGEPLAGQRAVMDVVLNRAREAGKPVCEIVKDGSQFQWYRKHPIKKMDEGLRNMLTDVNSQRTILKVENHFFHKSLKPSWAKNMKCRLIGSMRYCATNKERK